MAGPTLAGDVKDWLRGLGLEKYADAFAAQEIGLDVLADLSESDLRDLGIPMGPRKLMLRAIEALKQPAEAPPAHRRVDRPERRQLTVMFCDLVDSTALSRQLDPEDMREVIRAYQTLVTRHVTRFDGHIAGFAGDAVKVYFGFPRAHENQAERAIRTAMAIAQSVGALATPAAAPLAVRIGIATGLVVVGDLIGEGAAQEEMVVGETPNLAARLQAQGAPGDTVISATTRQLVGGLFELQGPTLLEVKGFKEPVEAWRVLGESRVANRFDALHAVDATPLSGRDREMAVLDHRWAQARRGKGQVVLIAGEPGIGKSRMVQEFSTRVAGDGAVVLSHQCWPHFVSTALHPFLDQARSFAEAGEVSPQGRERFFERFTDHIRQLSHERTVLLIVEDTHWADPSSLELLDLLVESAAACAVLVLLTFRPEFKGIGRALDHVTRLTLNRCGREAVMAMVDHLAAAANLPAAVREQIASQTDGVPLFVEELTKAILESREGNEIPATLYDSLMVRLDRLGPAKRVAQLASAIGREFSCDVLQAIAEVRREELEAALANLVAAEIVFPLQAVAGADYIFKHALVQDAAYRSLLGQQRRAIHAAIAQALPAAFPEVRERAPELLAHHLTLGRQDLQAIPYWTLAGQRAVRLSSYIEAGTHFHKALDLLRGLPAAEKDPRRELDLAVALATVQLATRGYGAPEVAAAFRDAKERCHALGGSQHLMPVLFGEWACAGHRQPIADVLQLSRGLRRAARASGDVGNVLMGERALGQSLLFAGQFAQARLYLDHAARTYDEERDQALAARYGLDLLTASLAHVLVAEWFLGFADTADEAGARALAHAEHIGHGNSLAHALVHAGLFLEQFRGNPTEILRHAERLHALAEGGGFPMFVAWGRVLEGWALFALGDPARGLAEMKDGISRSQQSGSILYQPYFLALLAGCHGEASDFAAGLDAVESALTFAGQRGEHWYSAEAWRLKGELLMRGGGDRPEAAAALRRALAIALRQRNAAFTQRARDSLAEFAIAPE